MHGYAECMDSREVEVHPEPGHSAAAHSDWANAAQEYHQRQLTCKEDAGRRADRRADRQVLGAGWSVDVSSPTAACRNGTISAVCCLFSPSEPTQVARQGEARRKGARACGRTTTGAAVLRMLAR